MSIILFWLLELANPNLRPWHIEPTFVLFFLPVLSSFLDFLSFAQSSVLQI